MPMIRLIDLRRRKDDWDGEGFPPTEEAITVAEQVINAQPTVVPCSDGGVQINWPNGAEITITPEGTFELE